LSTRDFTMVDSTGSVLTVGPTGTPRASQSGRRPTVGRGSSIAGVIILIWLIIGAIAAGQRGYFGGDTDTCAEASTIAVTVIAGPLNYLGVNPKVNCEVPEPSR